MEQAVQEGPILNEGILYPFSISIQQSFGKRRMVMAHWHNYIELLYCTSGKAKIFISGAGYDIAEGDMILINSKEVHSAFANTEGMTEYICIKIDPNILYSTSTNIFESKYVLPFTLSGATHQKLFYRNELKDTYVPELIYKILEESTTKKYGYELAIRNNIGNIFLWILRNWHEKGFVLNINNVLNKDTTKKLQKIFDFVENHYMEDISAKSVASEFNMSYSYFSRLFKKSVGKTFTSYLNYVRISQAEKLLISTDLTVTEIAMETGFSSTSYFIQQFKNYRAISPKQFKTRFMANNL